MSTAELQEANRLLDQNCPQEALELFRQYLLRHPPEFGAIWNMGVAEQQAKMQFADDLCAAHPNSSDATTIKVNAYFNAGYRQQAFDLITKAIDTFEAPIERMKFKRWRLGIAERAGHYVDFAADLHFV